MSSIYKLGSRVKANGVGKVLKRFAHTKNCQQSREKERALQFFSSSELSTMCARCYSVP